MKKQIFSLAALFCSITIFPSASDLNNKKTLAWPPAPTQASYLFAPGILESERYAANYCPTYRASTGEIVSRPGSMPILINPTSCNFPEVNLRQKPNFSTHHDLSLTSQILTIIQNRRRQEKDTILQVDIKPGSQELTVKNVDLDITKVNFGQEKDIATFSAMYDEHVTKHPRGGFVLHGFSRGAATVLNFLATDYQTKTFNAKRVRACILEACFDAIPVKPSLVPTWLFEWIFPGYNPTGIWPKNIIDHVPRNIPILLVTSKGDTRVPPHCVWSLYNALHATDHPYVHIVELDHASHPGYTYDNPQDREKYEAAVHAFYKKYGLPYDVQLAHHGTEHLK